MFAGFSEKSGADAGIRLPPAGNRHLANIVVGLSLGLGLLRMVDAENVDPALLGTALAGVIRSVERDPELRAEIADPAMLRRDADDMA